MPIDISTLATTRSMITNGMNSRKPIWNAVLSSLVRNAGARMVSGTSFGVAKPLPPETRTKAAISLSRSPVRARESLDAAFLTPLISARGGYR